MRKLKLFRVMFTKAIKEWKIPKPCEVLIYGPGSGEVLTPYLERYKLETVSFPESINIPIFLRAIFTSNFLKGRLHISYLETFVRAVRPCLIITFIDNDKNFYGLAKRFPSVKTIFVQNGVRGELGDVFGSVIQKEKSHVDHMLVFGSAIGEKYRSCISGSVMVIGSLKNNAVKKTSKVTVGSIVFISQYRQKQQDSASFLVDKDSNFVSHEEFYSADVLALKFLANWCFENKKTLAIAGVSPANVGPELEYYESILGGFGFNFMPRLDQYSSYHLVDAAEIVVFIDSTLGYESIARGKRTASFACRGVSLKSSATGFGWPADLPSNGPFWTNHQDEKQFQRIMDFLNTVSDEEWSLTRQCYATEIMEYDPSNARFVALLEQLLPTQWHSQSCSSH